MTCWITPDGGYYEGEHVADGSIQTTERPGVNYIASISNGVFVEWVFNAAQARLSACQEIDEKAGEIRESYISKGNLVDQEYKLAEKEASDWIAAGSPANAVPLSVSSWATAGNMSNDAAAANILATATALYGAMNNVRSARLIGKANVNASSTQAQVDSAKATAIANLEALRFA